MKAIPHDQLISNRIYYMHYFGGARFRFIKIIKEEGMINKSILFKPINGELYDYNLNNDGYISFSYTEKMFYRKGKNN